MKLNQLSWAALLAVATLFLAPPTDALARKLHVVIIADSQDKEIGEAAFADAANIELAFKASVMERDLNIVTMERGLSQRRILDQVGNLPVSPGDAILVYYSGHGAYPKDDGDQFLITGNQQNWISRSSIELAVRNKIELPAPNNKPGLGVVITDACFNFLNLTIPRQAAAADTKVEETQPLFDRLFFQTNGFISLNSCAKDEVAACHLDKQLGSVFTSAFVNVLFENQNTDAIGWNEVIDRTSKITRATFQDVFPDGETVRVAGRQFENQESQNPQKLEFQVREVGIQAQMVQTFTTFEADIDPKTGKVETWMVTHTLDLRTGKRTQEIGTRENDGVATIQLADDGRAFWEYGTILVRAPKKFDGPPRQRFLGVNVVKPALGRLFPGVRITRVVANSPATRVWDGAGETWKLDVRDRILSIGGMPTPNVPAFIKAVKAGQANDTILIYDAALRKQRLFMVNLANNGQGPAAGLLPPALPGAGAGQLGAGAQAAAAAPAGQLGAAGGPPPGNPAGGPFPRKKLRFGATVVRDPRGLRIAAVDQDSPAMKCSDDKGQEIYLEVRDIVTHINGQPVNTVRQYKNAVLNSSQQMRITVLNSKDDHKTMELSTLLRN